MSNRIFKNYQVNLGIPFQIRTPINLETIEKINELEQQAAENEPLIPEDDAYDITAKAQEEAEAIIREAELEAARIIETAEKESRAKCNDIEGQAWQKGYEEGLNEGKHQYDEMIGEAEQARDQAKLEHGETLKSIEAEAVNVILNIARRVIGDEISLKKDNMLYLVRDAFEKCTNRDSLILRVSSDDYDFINENSEKLLSMVEGIGELTIKKDPSLKQGACMIDTPFGSVDAGAQTKMKKIEEAFLQAVGKQSADGL